MEPGGLNDVTGVTNDVKDEKKKPSVRSTNAIACEETLMAAVANAKFPMDIICMLAALAIRDSQDIDWIKVNGALRDRIGRVAFLEYKESVQKLLRPSVIKVVLPATSHPTISAN
jgi:hypothetical protein